MKNEKLALAMIVKGNEDGKRLARCLESVKKYVDGIFITTTQSKTGGEVDIAKAFGAKLSHFDWIDDFSAARNYNFSQVPKEYKYILWLDDDDILRHGDKLRDAFNIMLSQHLDAIYMRYNYDIDESTGQVLIVHPRERIIKRSSYVWKGMLHETMVAQREIKAAQTDMVWVDHYPPASAKKTNFVRNIRILEKAYKKEGDKHDPRTEYYLARSYFDMGSEDETCYPKAEKMLHDYLEHSGWDEERAFAWNYLGEIYRIGKKYDDAIDCYFQAMKEKENFPSWYINLGVIYGLKGDWERAIFWTRRGLSIKVPRTAMVLSPRDDKARALETLFLAFKAQNKLEEAENIALKMLKMFPKEKVIEERVRFIRGLRDKVKLAKGVYSLTQELVKNNEKDKIETLLGSLPISVADNAFIQNIKRTYLPPKKWKKKSIVWFCGRGFEPWSPDNLKTGIGGSETAVIQLSKHWAKLGYDVTVFGYPQKEKDYDGVHYKQYWRFNNLDEFDTLIIWRNPWILDQEYHANRLFLDLHDVPSPAEFTEERMAKVDKIFVKSKYHRDFLPNVKDDKFVVITNGFDPALIKDGVGREGNKLIYASSYDRGLEWMLRYGWPVVRKEVPDAELHIYYGWNLFDSAHKGNPERQLWKKKMLKLMEQDGVFEHGRVGQDVLIQKTQEAQILYYATSFEEIDCITVRQGAFAGAVPVTTDYSALKERKYCVRIPGDPYDKETQEAVAKKVASLLKNKDALKKQRKLSLELVNNETWENIAKSWTKYL